MSLLNPIIEGDSVTFDRQECEAVGRKLHSSYVNADPYAHIVMDDFLPQDLLQRVLKEFPQREKGAFADAHSQLKTGYQLEMIKSLFITNLMYAMNSAQFIRFLEELTGIENLVVDPHYAGGGLHETARGGHLSIHADFNVHPKYPIRRRMNLILFLNEDWEDAFGGHLELWNEDMTAAVHRVLPVIGRAVIFNTDEKSFHGHPEPLTCPEDRYRRSIALYYYTAVPDPNLVRVTTKWQQRPGTGDRRQSALNLRTIAQDFCPPVITRFMKRLKPRG